MGYDNTSAVAAGLLRPHGSQSTQNGLSADRQMDRCARADDPSGALSTLAFLPDWKAATIVHFHSSDHLAGWPTSE